jgi:hypothetical protein
VGPARFEVGDVLAEDVLEVADRKRAAESRHARLTIRTHARRTGDWFGAETVHQHLGPRPTQDAASAG